MKRANGALPSRAFTGAAIGTLMSYLHSHHMHYSPSHDSSLPVRGTSQTTGSSGIPATLSRAAFGSPVRLDGADNKNQTTLSVHQLIQHLIRHRHHVCMAMLSIRLSSPRVVLLRRLYLLRWALLWQSPRRYDPARMSWQQ